MMRQAKTSLVDAHIYIDFYYNEHVYCIHSFHCLGHLEAAKVLFLVLVHTK